jgi:hypothetical protein
MKYVNRAFFKIKNTKKICIWIFQKNLSKNNYASMEKIDSLPFMYL